MIIKCSIRVNWYLFCNIFSLNTTFSGKHILVHFTIKGYSWVPFKLQESLENRGDTSSLSPRNIVNQPCVDPGSLCEVLALQGHDHELRDHFATCTSWVETPVESFDLDDFDTWLDNDKSWFKTVEHDCRDAKRRVSLQKGPKAKAAQVKAAKLESGSEDEVSEEDEPTS